MAITINGTSGITTPELTLDNTAADGGQVVLKSAGYSNWNLDNYSGSLRAYYNATEYMRMDSSGNLGIGTSSPLFKLSTLGNANIGNNDSSNPLNYLRFGATQYGAADIRPTDETNHKVGLSFYTDGTADTTINPTERMRIDSNGTNLIGCTGGGAAGNMQVLYGSGSDIQKVFSTQASSGSYSLVSMFSNATTPSSPSGTLRVNILTNGGIQNYQANNSNLSDERTKTDINLAGSYLNKICAIPVKTFKYKDQTDNELNLGVIAQDVEAVAPELVDVNGFGKVPEDGVPLKAIYQTDLQYALMKCIQEQQAIITDLKARVESLENK